MAMDGHGLALTRASASAERGAVDAEIAASASPSHPRVRASVRGTIIAESDRTILVEGNHYFPPESVRQELLSRSAAVTVCVWKGLARYRSIEIDGARLARGAWCYPQPLPWIRKIKDHVAFGPGVVIAESPDP